MKNLVKILVICVYVIFGAYSFYMINLEYTTELGRIDILIEYWYLHIGMLLIGCVYLFSVDKINKLIR